MSALDGRSAAQLLPSLRTASCVHAAFCFHRYRGEWQIRLKRCYKNHKQSSKVMLSACEHLLFIGRHVEQQTGLWVITTIMVSRVQLGVGVLVSLQDD